jgi:Fic family protein
MGSHNFVVINSIKDLLRTTNSYYSNKIESEGTHPIDIEKAMRKDFSTDALQKKLQLLSLAHIQTQKSLEQTISLNHNLQIFTQEFILHIHKEFYSKEGMNQFLEIKTDEKSLRMIPGKFRNDDVYIAKHLAPKHTELETIMNFFQSQYSAIYKQPTRALKLLYALSSHHRLTWVHPFLDGNGRVSRLFLDAALYNIKLDGYGLWNISRGLARESDEYKKHLAFADMPTQGATDGRDPLSLRGLEYYLKYMLENALEQIEFMNKNLQLSSLGDKIDRFVLLSTQKMLNTKPLPKQAALLFKELLLQGELARGRVKDIINTKDRTASTLIKTLIEMDYLESDTPKGAIRLKFNAEFASYIMPDLIPKK